jgi:hypothetical protein
LPTLRFAAVRRRTDGAGGFFLSSMRCMLPQIAVVEKPADHVRRDLTCALLVKPVPGHEASIGTGKRSLEASMKKPDGLDDDHAGSAAVKMAIGQPEEWRCRFGLLGHAASIGRELCPFDPAEKPRPLPKLLGNKSRSPHGAIYAGIPHARFQRQPQRRRSG